MIKIHSSHHLYDYVFNTIQKQHTDKLPFYTISCRDCDGHELFYDENKLSSEYDDLIAELTLNGLIESQCIKMGYGTHHIMPAICGNIVCI